MGTFGGSVHLAFKKGTSSLVNRSKFVEGDEGDDDADEEDDDDENGTEDFDEDSIGRRGSSSRWSEEDAWMSESASSATPSTRRNSRRSSSTNGSGIWRPRVKQQHSPSGGGRAVRESRRESSSASASQNRQGDSGEKTTTTKLPRPRRFSSNGPEAAIMRHETVIGIHTPRRESLSSSASSVGTGAPAQQQLERLSLAPLSKISPVSGPVSQVSPAGASSPAHAQSGTPRTRKPKQRTSSTDLLAQAAAAAAASAQRVPADNDQESLSVESMVQQAREKAQLRQEQLEGVEHDRSDDSLQSGSVSTDGMRLTSSQLASRSTSPRLALKLARRRKPIPVDGTLYDRTGPFREGAVTDGLSVRLFSAEDTGDGVGYAEDEDQGAHQHSHVYHSSNLRRSNQVHEDAVADDDMVPTTYLITTPDNRVSSAAKLRRWAMDGDGRFYAAMEIKSIEAKMRNVDPNLGANSLSKALLRELKERYVDDILDEVQKAETLNPGRMAVAKVLKTSDGKYVRLEEDYPEEAFFVIAGCEESELYPVVAMVFVNALRAIVGFHAAGWLHGDIKLENLMFDEQSRLIVIDYENANPYRGIPGGDGRVTLASYDWIPPEAFAGPQGRRVGPSADLWALGCNVVRAFALRDDIEDTDIRETLLGKGQSGFLQFRRSRLLKRSSTGAIPASLPTPDDVDLTAILSDEEGEGLNADDPRVKYMPPPPGPSPKRLLERFARDAPELCKLVIARCISDRPEERGVEAEADCLTFADALERGEVKCEDLKAHETLLSVGERAVRTAIDLSGSAWVRPKLDDARLSLGL